ncbi:MAG: MgtC/SapB family protein [Nitrospiraceae bacterium]|nr:MAG: MgtC/SapB family protein [Nitrospiraceae bacterium]
MITVQEMAIRLLLGAVIGGVIGFEREVHGRAAGFRTQLIVCVAAVLIMVVSENYYFRIHNLDDTLRIDPARISAGALIGIGFLGSGVIVKSGFAIRGLTTAATIWIVSAIGLAIGGGLYYEGLLTFLVTITALMALRVVEKRINFLRYKVITVSMPVTEKKEEALISMLSSYGFHVHSINYEKNLPAGEITYHLTVSTRNRHAIRDIFRELGSADYINKIKIDG